MAPSRHLWGEKERFELKCLNQRVFENSDSLNTIVACFKWGPPYRPIVPREKKKFYNNASSIYKIIIYHPFTKMKPSIFDLNKYINV